MKVKISLLGLILLLFVLISCGGGGGSGSSDVIADNTNNEDTNDNNGNNEDNAQSNFIQVLDENYTLKQVMASDIGLQAQITLLPTGEVVIADPNYNRIAMLSNNSVKVLTENEKVNGWGGVTALSDGRICYTLWDGQLILMNPFTGAKSNLGAIPDGPRVNALAADELDNIYAATSHQELYRFGLDGVPVKIVDNLPYDIEWGINDMDIDPNGIIYIAGYSRVVAVRPDGTVEIIADNLQYEPVWVEVGLDGYVYINEYSYGLQRYNPADGKLESFKPEGLFPFGDIVFLSDNEVMYYEFVRAYYKYNLTTNIATPLLVIPGNSNAFAVDNSNTAFFSTPSKPPFLDSHIMSLTRDGDKKDIYDLTYGEIYAADVDKNNRLCLSTNLGFIRIEQDNSITTINPIFESEDPPCCIHWLATGPDNKWYVLSTNYDDLITIYRFDDSGKVEFLPITFDKASFGGAYRVTQGNINIDNDGHIAMIVTAVGSLGQGPFYQRIYTADSDGTNLTEIGNLDSERLGGPVDIAFAPNGDLFVLSVQDYGDNIYRIDHQSHIITEFINCETGHDPASMDVDLSGNVWITTTNGIFMAEPRF